MDSESDHIRLSAVGIVAISLFLALFVRLWFLQGIDRREFEAASVTNRIRVLHEEAPRGRILDRTGKVLVDNRTSIVVALNRDPLRKMDEEQRTELFVDLADTLGSFGVPTKLASIEKAYNDTRYAPQAYVPVVEDVPEEVEIYLSEWHDRFPGVVVERKAIRVYPYGNLGVHLLGYVGEINAEELKTMSSTGEADDGAAPDAPSPDTEDPDYQLGDSIGKSGVEKSAEVDLRGTPGKRTVEVNAQGELVDVVSVDPAVAGDDVWLSIDVDLQAHAERLLEAKILQLRGGLDKDGNRLNVPQGSVVVQDPNNGEILTLVSYPDYDPSSVVNGISQSLWDSLMDPNSGQPLYNWALQGTYAPGSTFKPFTALAGLRAGIVSPTEIVYDRGFYDVENCRSGKCQVQNAGRTAHGNVDLARSLAVSSDVFYYRIGDKLWNRASEFGETPIQDAAKEFGLGSRTGIPLPGENAGRLPTPEQRRQAFEARPDLFEHGNWYSGDSINVSIGQGDVLVTPLQLVDSYSALANGGTRYQPQIVTKVTKSKDGTKPPSEEGNFVVVREQGPTVNGKVEMTPEQYAHIWDGLARVTTEGTAASSFAATPTAWPMAGKTGTAQVNKKADTALFAGWGPAIAGTPAQYTISVVIPESGFGSDVAAPLAFRILGPISDGTLMEACTLEDADRCELAVIAAEQASVTDTGGGTAG